MSTKGKTKGVVVNDAEVLRKEAEKELTPEALDELSNGKGDDEDE